MDDVPENGGAHDKNVRVINMDRSHSRQQVKRAETQQTIPETHGDPDRKPRPGSGKRVVRVSPTPDNTS